MKYEHCKFSNGRFVIVCMDKDTGIRALPYLAMSCIQYSVHAGWVNWILAGFVAVAVVKKRKKKEKKREAEMVATVVTKLCFHHR